MSVENCKNNHHEDEPIKFAQKSNFILGLAGIVVGAVSGSNAALADGLHNLADSAAHKSHQLTAESERHNKDQSVISKHRKRAALLIGSGALLIGAYSTYELATGEPEASLNVPAMSVELASVGLNGLVAYKFAKKESALSGHNHSARHNLVDLGSSGIALTGIAAATVLPNADNFAGLVVSGVTLGLATQMYFGKIE